MRIFVGSVTLILFALCLPVSGQDDPDLEKPTKKPVASETVSVTHRQVKIGGEFVAYEAKAGYLHLPDYEGKPRADIFHIAYTRPVKEGAPPRPITFAFNGGPGSSSVWLHLGTMGPRRVKMGPEGEAPEPPYTLVDNPHSWLAFTDLVFIDPVTTGYSRAAEGVSAKDFHGLTEDVRAVGDFIRLYLTREKRWSSPKFLCGESYGTTRAAELTGYLQNTLGAYLNGVLLISPILNFQTARFSAGNDLPYWLFFPTYTATAFYHKRLEESLSKDLQATLRESEEFARGEYLLALAKGDDLTGEEFDATARKVARLTGLSVGFVKRSRLRINIRNFTKELLRDDGRSVGRLDSRFKGIDRDGIGSGPDYDPSMAAIRGPYTACLYDYVRKELGYENDLVYEILTGRVHPWNYGSHENRFVNVAETLRAAMSRNRDLKVFYASGYYDLATPYFAMDYTASHMGLPPELRKNISSAYYEAGHMMYIREHDLEKLAKDAAAFYAGAVPK